MTPEETIEVPREFVDTMLKSAGILRGIAGIPAQIAMRLGVESLPPMLDAMAAEMSKPDAVCDISFGVGALRFRLVIK